MLFNKQHLKPNPMPHPAPMSSTHSSSPPSSSDTPNLTWPAPGNPPRPPTPYAIFAQSPTEPYSKRRFYELVKLYHPDRLKHSPISLTHSPTELTERYRLVIAANVILSSPSKRALYDRSGHGWLEAFDVSEAYGGKDGSYKYGTHHRWRTDGSAAYNWPVDQDPMYNATWEDWERWYRAEVLRRRGNHRRYPAKGWRDYFSSDGRRHAADGAAAQAPVYANNYAFISIVFLLAALGGAGQATRANGQAKTRLERSQIVNDQTSKVLMEARQNTREQDSLQGQGGAKDRRIRRFLSQSGDYPEGEFDPRAQRPGDEGLCAPGLIKDKDERRFWEKPPENR